MAFELASRLSGQNAARMPHDCRYQVEVGRQFTPIALTRDGTSFRADRRMLCLVRFLSRCFSP
jgi:hypothetical protein